MKKNTIKVVLVFAFALFAGYGIYNTQSATAFSNLVIDNVEALASGESGGYTGCTSGDGYCAIYVGSSCIFSSNSHYPY